MKISNIVIDKTVYFFFQSVETSRRYEKLGSLVQAISATQDLNAFVKTLNIPESMTVSKHSFAPPNPADPAAVRFIQNPDSSTFFCSPIPTITHLY